MHTQTKNPARVNAPLEFKDDDHPKAADDGGRAIMEAWADYQEKNDNILKAYDKRLADPIGEAELKKIDAYFDAHEGLNKKLTAGIEAAKTAAELEKRFDAVEAALSRKGFGGGTEEKVDRSGLWAKAVFQAFDKGEANLSEDERKVFSDVKAEYKALNLGTDPDGGYLAPPEFVRTIIAGITDLSDIRPLVSVRNTAMRAIQVPKRTGQFSAVRAHEMATVAETTGLAYGLEEIVAPMLMAIVDLTNDMMEDSAFDMAAEIEAQATERFAVKEGQEFVSGTGVDEMEGILTNADVAETVSGSALAITADGMLTMKHAIKSGYARNASWLMNRATIGSVRKLKDSSSAYIWTPGIAQGAPNTIDGDPYHELPDMPTEAAGAYPLAYGDFKRAYTLLDRINMSMVRDTVTRAAMNQIRFLFRRRTGGKVVLAEAIRKMKCST